MHATIVHTGKLNRQKLLRLREFDGFVSGFIFTFKSRVDKRLKTPKGQALEGQRNTFMAFKSTCP